MSIYEEHKARYEFEMADPYRCHLTCEELDKDSCPICNPRPKPCPFDKKYKYKPKN